MSDRQGSWLVGQGEMAQRIRQFDWSSHALGDMDHWPIALQVALGLCINSSMPTAIYWGPDLHLLYNDAWSVVPRDRHPKALGQKGSELWTDIWDVVGPQFEQILSEGSSVTTFDQMLPIERDGVAEETYWNYTLSPIVDQEGKVVGVFNQGHETTDRVLASRQRTAEIDRMRDLFAQAPGAIAVLKGPNHVFEIANAAYLDMTGARESIRGRPVAEVLPEVVAQGFLDLLNQVYETGEPFVGSEVPVELTTNGLRQTKIVDFVYQPTRDAGGQIDGIFVEAWDVTERSHLLNELRQLTSTLEERVQAEVAMKLDAENRLTRIQRLEAIGQLTGGIAHDFNNMLAVIISALNILERKLGKTSPDHNRLIDAAKDGAQRASGLTRQLLAFAKQQSLAPSTFDAHALVESMIDLINRALGENIAVQFEGEPEAWHILADRAQLENAILNLAINGRDAMPDGGQLTLSVRNEFVDETRAETLDIQSGEYVCIMVRDTGTGMSEDVAEKAFEPFFTTKEVGKGTGLGLSQVIGFIQQSNGQISLDTEVGRGTCFSLYLPRSTDEHSAEFEPSDASTVETGHGELILVVEDDDQLRSFTEEALREIGYKVETAANAGEAKTRFQSGPRPDLLLTDIVMPGQSGLALAAEIRQLDETVGILFMSGHAFKVSDEDDDIPASDLLKKPFTLEELSARVSSALAKQAGSARR